MSNWNYIIRRVRISEKKSVEKLACPNCGGSLILGYGKYPNVNKRIKKDSYLSVKCKQCLNGITNDGNIDEPPWAKTCGGMLETTPHKTKKG